MGSQQVRLSKAGRFNHSLKNPERIHGGGGDGREGGGGGIRSGLGDAFTQAAGVIAVEGFAEAFLQTVFLRVGGDHPAPSHGLEKALGQADLPKEGQGGKSGTKAFQEFLKYWLRD